MSSSTSHLNPLPAPLASQVEQVQDRRSWWPSGYLLSPSLDLLFIANLYWPLLFLFASPSNLTSHQSLLFWQVYFVTAPHRWITLILIACDRQKTIGREGKVIGLAALVVIGCLLWRLNSSALICLGLIDYCWNAWHFASQHHGIYRIYERNQQPRLTFSQSLIEKYVYRFFLLYVIARVSGMGWSQSDWSGLGSLQHFDYAVALIPIAYILRQTWRVAQGGSVWSLLYLMSVCTLYGAMLYTSHMEWQRLTVQLAFCSAVFHAVEYLSVVTWASSSEKNRQRLDLWGKLTRSWGAFLVFFILFIGITNYVIAQGHEETWILVNLMAAFLHYGYDGMIWKTNRKLRSA